MYLKVLQAFILILMMSVASGVIHAQSDAISVPQQFSQPSSRTPEIELSSRTQKSGGGYLGVYLGDINEERAKELKLAEVRGAVIGKVEESSPAEKAGLQENDVIIGFNDQRIQNRAHFNRLLTEMPPGSKLTLSISRQGQTRNVSIELGQRRIGVIDARQRLFSAADAYLASAEERRQQAEELLQKGDEKGARKLQEEERGFRTISEQLRASIEADIRDGKIEDPTSLRRPNYSGSTYRYLLGLTVAPLSEQLAKFFNISDGGVLITEVRAGGAAERAGIKAGDCIIAINDEHVASTSKLNSVIDRLGRDESGKEKEVSDLTLTIVRERSEQKIKVKIEPRS